MNFKYIIYILFFGALFLSACSDEDTIVPREVDQKIRFVFPQGENTWDAIAADIQKKFDVYIIYTAFDSVDINRNWSATAGSGLRYHGKVLTNEQAAYYLNFMKTQLFDYLDPSIFKPWMPIYLYLVYNGKKGTSDFTEYFTGKDFWTFSLLSDTRDELKTKTEYQTFRGRFLLVMFNRALTLGQITIPDEFNKGFDYKTPLNGYTPSDDNYWKKRGILQVAETTFAISYPYSSSMTPENNFSAYIGLCMRYTAEEYEKEFPESSYPLMAKKRAWMLNFLKTKFNFDAEKVAEGPEI